MIVVNYCQPAPPFDHDHGNRRACRHPHQDQTSVLIIYAPLGAVGEHKAGRPARTEAQTGGLGLAGRMGVLGVGVLV
jgi:hypothetical protein